VSRNVFSSTEGEIETDAVAIESSSRTGDRDHKSGSQISVLVRKRGVCEIHSIGIKKKERPGTQTVLRIGGENGSLGNTLKPLQ